MAFSRILVPVDFSEPAAHALALAGRLAAETGARITVLFVSPFPATDAANLGLHGAAAEYVDELEEVFEEAHQERLVKLCRDLLPADVPWVARARAGETREEILQEAGEGGHDLVVMGTHGRTGLSRALLGSVTEAVVRHSSIPVLVARRPASDPQT